jgi:hypothetical protein
MTQTNQAHAGTVRTPSHLSVDLIDRESSPEQIPSYRAT